MNPSIRIAGNPINEGLLADSLILGLLIITRSIVQVSRS